MKAIFGLCCVFAVICPLHGISGGDPATNEDGAKGVALIEIGFGRALPPYCMGALITNRMVLTSAMCCVSEYGLPVTVHVCSTTPFDSGQFYTVIKRRLFGKGEKEVYKLCALMLNREVHLSKFCTPLALPAPRNQMNSSNQVLNAFGYGSTVLDKPKGGDVNPIYDRVLNRELMALEMPPAETQNCAQTYAADAKGSYNMFCFGYPADRLKRLMLDDHGAPLVGSKDNTLYGILLTYPMLRPGLSWKKTPHPVWAIDVLAAKPDIINAIKEMLKDDRSEFPIN